MFGKTNKGLVFNLRVLLIFFSTIQVAQCFVPGRCTDSTYVDLAMKNSAEDCLDACKANTECAW